MLVDIANHLLFEVAATEIAQCLVDFRLRARHADNHAAKGHIFYLVDIAKEDGNVELRELLDGIGEHGVIRIVAEKGQTQQLMLPGTEKLSNSDLRKFEVDLSTPDATVPLTVSNGKMNYRWLTNKDNGRIAEAHVKYESKTDGVSRLDWKYTDFRPVGVKMFPASQAFSFTTAKGNKNHEATVTIRMDEVKTSSDWEEQSTVSDKYKKMDASDVLGKILSM